jgi:hypothetical protein
MVVFHANNYTCFSKSHPRKEVPALATVSADEFKHILMEKLQKKPVVVIFAEENVSLYNVLNAGNSGHQIFL